MQCVPHSEYKNMKETRAVLKEHVGTKNYYIATILVIPAALGIQKNPAWERSHEKR